MMIAHIGWIEGSLVALAILCATLVVALGLAVWAKANTQDQDNPKDNR